MRTTPKPFMIIDESLRKCFIRPSGKFLEAELLDQRLRVDKLQVTDAKGSHGFATVL